MSHNVYNVEEATTLNKLPTYLIYNGFNIVPFNNIKLALLYCARQKEICTLFENVCESWKEICDICPKGAR